MTFEYYTNKEKGKTAYIVPTGDMHDDKKYLIQDIKNPYLQAYKHTRQAARDYLEGKGYIKTDKIRTSDKKNMY